MTRKLLSLLVAVALLLTTMSVAFAAAPSDVVGTDYNKAVTRLSSLGIMQGYPDGTFKPDQTITRAEFAKIAVTALGLKDSATISAGATQFSDVAATHWATGYINVASAQGIVTGYPDGSFKPDQTINYSEAIAIILRMLGYKPILDGKAWPTAYIAKANEIKVTDGVALTPTVGAPRGNVAKLMNNALTAKMLYIDSWSNGIPVYKNDDENQNLLQVKLSMTKVTSGTAGTNDKWVVTNTPSLQPGSTVGASTLTNDGNSLATTPLKFANGLNANDYLGLTLKAWTNTDGDIAVVEVQTASTDYYDGIVAKDDTKLKLVGLSQSYNPDTTAVDTVVNATYVPSSFTSFLTILGNDKATGRVVLKDGKIKKAYVWMQAAQGDPDANTTTCAVKEVKDNEVRGYNGVGDVVDIKALKDDMAVKNKLVDVTKDGKVATLDDIKAGDILTQVVNGTHYTYIDSSTQAKGTLTGISGTGSDMTLTIGGTGYTLAQGHVFSFDAGANYNKYFGDLKDVVGKDVTVTLNSAGQIFTLVSSTVSSTYYYGIYKSSNINVGTVGSDSSVTLYKADGTKVTYLFDNAGDVVAANQIKWDNGTTSGTDTTFAAGDIVQYQLTSDGKIKKNTFVKNAANMWDSVVGTTAAASTTIDNNIITNAGVNYYVTASSVIFDTYKMRAPNTDDAQIIPFSSIKNQTGLTYHIVYKDSVAKIIEVNGNGTINTTTNGVVQGTGIDVDGQTATIMVGSTSTTYKLDTVTATNLVKGSYVDFNIGSNGKIDGWNTIGTLVYNKGVFGSNSVYIYRIDSIDTANRIITLKTLGSNKLEQDPKIVFSYDKDVKVYDATNKDAIVGGKAATDLSASDYVWVDAASSSPTTVINTIIKTKKDNLADN